MATSPGMLAQVVRLLAEMDRETAGIALALLRGLSGLGVQHLLKAVFDAR